MHVKQGTDVWGVVRAAPFDDLPIHQLEMHVGARTSELSSLVLLDAHADEAYGVRCLRDEQDVLQENSR